MKHDERWLEAAEQWSTNASRRGVSPQMLKGEPEHVLKAFAEQRRSALQGGRDGRLSPGRIPYGVKARSGSHRTRAENPSHIFIQREEEQVREEERVRVEERVRQTLDLANAWRMDVADAEDRCRADPGLDSPQHSSSPRLPHGQVYAAPASPRWSTRSDGFSSGGEGRSPARRSIERRASGEHTWR